MRCIIWSAVTSQRGIWQAILVKCVFPTAPFGKVSKPDFSQCNGGAEQRPKVDRRPTSANFKAVLRAILLCVARVAKGLRTVVKPFALKRPLSGKPRALCLVQATGGFAPILLIKSPKLVLRRQVVEIYSPQTALVNLNSTKSDSKESFSKAACASRPEKPLSKISAITGPELLQQKVHYSITSSARYRGRCRRPRRSRSLTR